MRNKLRRPGGRRTFVGVAVATALATGLAACGGGGTSGQATAAGQTTGHITLTVQNGDGGETGLLGGYAKLNAAFERLHPNVTIRFVTKNFTDLVNTLKLQLSGPNPPDLTQVNQGYSSMGALVAAHLLRPLDAYASRYGWAGRQSAGLLAIDGRMSPTGKTMGSGTLWGVAASGAWVGLWENKKVLASLGLSQPTTFGALERDLAVAKQHGVVPIQYGASDGGESIWLFEDILMAQTSPEEVESLIEARPGASFDSAAVIGAAQTLQQWANAGYFTPGFAAYNNTDAFSKFAVGKGLFDINGSFNTGVATGAYVNELTMLPVPPAAGVSASPAAIATGDIAWAIPVASRHAAIAAEYLDYITSQQAAKVLIAAGQVPATSSPDQLAFARASNVTGSPYDALAQWIRVMTKGVPVPYMDWSTPTFYNTLSAAVTELASNKLTPRAFAGRLEGDYGAFVGRG